MYILHYLNPGVIDTCVCVIINLYNIRNVIKVDNFRV